MAEPLAQQDLAACCRHLAARSPTPGGGAASAIAAALGSALAAMALRYSDRPRHGGDQASALAEVCSDASTALLADADADAVAYTALCACPTDAIDPAERDSLACAARAVPLRILTRCAELATALAHFLPHCNPQLRCDALAALDLLLGAGRAAWRILLAGDPPASERAGGQAALAQLDRACTPP